MTSINIGGARDPDAEPGDSIDIDGIIDLSQIEEDLAALVEQAPKFDAIVATGDLRDPEVFPTGLTDRGATGGSNAGQRRNVKGADDDTVSVEAAQFYAWMQAHDPMGLYLRSSSGAAQIRFRKKLAEGAAKVALIGDSWGVLPNFGQGIKDRLCGLTGGKYPNAEYGWINAYSLTALDGVTVTYSGDWTRGDVPHISRDDTYDWGPDGYWCSATGTSGTIIISDAASTATATVPTFTDYSVYYYDGDGTFRVKIDGGSWNVVAGGSTDTWLRYDLTGLSDAGHVVTLDLTGNTGTVALYGHYLGRSAGTGVSFSDMGHSGGRVYSWGGQRFNIGKGILRPNGTAGDGLNFGYEIMQDLGFDAFIFVSGTNDAETGGGIGYYTYGLTQAITALQSMDDGIGIIVAPSPQTGVAGTLYQTEESLAVEALRICNLFKRSDTQHGVDFWSLWADLGPFLVADALGYYTGDENHVTEDGGQAAGIAFIRTGIL